MNRIRFAANPDTNYVYHMLSVARCGYDNTYGARFRPDYPPEDLAILNSHEDMITVGDNTNDYHMIQAFRSYAMANGVPSIKELADFVTPGVAELIERELQEGN